MYLLQISTSDISNNTNTITLNAIIYETSMLDTVFLKFTILCVKIC